ncbi:MAG: QVPTGV class sortase B protein-sorting domain-containing protein [Bacteroidales bacterium]
MKKAGIVILILGLVLTLVTTVTFFTREKIVDMGEIQISANKRHKLNWSPFIGLGVMAVGGVLMLVPKK